MRNLFIITVLLFMTINLFADEIEELKIPLQKIEYDDSLFKFTTHVIENRNGEIVTKIVGFNPRLENPSLLISIDGRAPTKKELENHNKENNRNNQDDNTVFRGEHYKLIWEKDNLAMYEFFTKESFIPKMNFKLKGELLVDRDKNSVIKLILTNPEKFNSIAGSLNKFYMEFNYMDYNDKYTVIDTMKIDMEGKVLIKNFSHNTSIDFKDYFLIN